MEDITGRILLSFAKSLLHKDTGEDAFYILQLLNPDGTQIRWDGDPASLLHERVVRMNGGSLDFDHWQANARGVDLNHNYPTGFEAYKVWEKEHEVGEGAPTLYSGAHPLSEPECKSLLSFIEGIGPTFVLTLHSQ
jgi:g-D-glutamyl-meso-diaminopimelate peptidase